MVTNNRNSSKDSEEPALPNTKTNKAMGTKTMKYSLEIIELMAEYNKKTMSSHSDGTNL